jgi:DNA polymerase
MAAPDARALRQRLESLEAAGVLQIPRAAGHAGAPPIVQAVPAPALASATVEEGGRAAVLQVLAEQVMGCTQCAELASTRTQTVFGVGRVDARICFFGEAPGADEDASGEPFVGPAGQLLTKIIEACRLRREDVYILNVLKCRPPGNRTPLPDEVASCRGYFERQFQVIAPAYICCLGATAAKALLQTDESIGRLRKRWFTYGSAKVICTYHPSYLLRNPEAKRDVWDDMKAMMADMGVDL